MADIFSSPSGSDYYLALRNSNDPWFAERRDHVTELWRRFEPYSERQFKSAVPRNVAQRHWEMYVCCQLLDVGLVLCKAWAKQKSNAGFDFKILLKKDRVLWVEATTCSPGDSTRAARTDAIIPTGTEYNESLIKESNGSYASGQHLNVIQHRVSTVFDSKLKQLQRLLDYRLINPKDHIVFAIGGGKIPGLAWGDNLSDTGAIVSLFAPIGVTSVIDLRRGPIYKIQQYVSNDANRPILKPFEQRADKERDTADAELVSGVLFSDTSIESSSIPWRHETVWINNYRATNPIDPKIFGEPIQRVSLQR